MTDSNSDAPRMMALLPQLDDDHFTRLMLCTGLFLLAALVVFVPVWLLDPRILDSAAIWTKPQKFNISLGLHFVTLAVLAHQVPRATRTGPLLIGFGYLAVISLVFEFVYVNVQAARGARSHFNMETSVEQIMYALMGLGAFLMVLVAFVLAIQIWRKGDRSNRGLWLGSIVGLTAGFAITLVFAGQMSSIGRFVGAPLSGGGEIVPFFGWSREYGDLRPSHFVSLHLMQTLPLAGYIADRQKWPTVPIVIGLGVMQIALAVALYMQALAGQPFWPA
ncbi:hypothetical protein [Altererythrobacter sp. ZODW24]|uniref:hypothetical protein n=1 Tax=Altererythrobacter sp. ZODW24 TaxID=2185142 RepID=UPI000DF751DF|nr:hypothetical protein [Altererythrobacter sp. ZODW24]